MLIDLFVSFRCQFQGAGLNRKANCFSERSDVDAAALLTFDNIDCQTTACHFPIPGFHGDAH
ncbi:MAG: hypothetical protein AAF420_07590, partial [Pseudomonadota bacterium]